jgi:hypothetical protein
MTCQRVGVLEPDRPVARLARLTALTMRAPLSPSRSSSSWIPPPASRGQYAVGGLSLLGEPFLRLAHPLVGGLGAGSRPLACWGAAGHLEPAKLERGQRRLLGGVVVTARERAAEQHGELARGGDLVSGSFTTEGRSLRGSSKASALLRRGCSEQPRRLRPKLLAEPSRFREATRATVASNNFRCAATSRPRDGEWLTHDGPTGETSTFVPILQSSRSQSEGLRSASHPLQDPGPRHALTV